MLLKVSTVYHRVGCGCGRIFDSVRAWWASILFTILLALISLNGCNGGQLPNVTCVNPLSTCDPGDLQPGPPKPCPKTFYVYCENGKDHNQCCDQKEIGSYATNLKQLPVPDLSYTTLDGLVDFGTTKLKIETADGDSLETKLKGRLAMSGGFCAEDKCSLKILFFEFTSVEDKLRTVNGKEVRGLLARNANTWTGTRQMSDGTIIMDSTNKLALEGYVGDKKQGVVLNPNTWFKGAIYKATRITDNGSSVNNRIEVTGNFADNNIKTTLTINIWATNCEPAVQPSAQCAEIESGSPGFLLLTATFFKLMENLQSSQDLCDTLMVPDPVQVCKPGMRDEFPTFTCKTQPLPPGSSPAEIAKQLKFSWTDATGYVLSDQFEKTLDWMPVFPITLTVENKWGRKVDAKVMQASQSYNCPKGMEYLTDRGGSNYKNFDVPQADPALCQTSCDQEAQCKAWTYVKPGIKGPKAWCCLKFDVPPAKPDECCLSGVKGMEYLTDRRGSDYKDFDLSQADPASCRTSCEQETQCKAWTYVKPGIQGPKARCWLKRNAPRAKPDSCCVSGVKGIEYATDRAGSDYKDSDLSQVDPVLCRTSCDEETKCKAWTYVKPGFQGPKPRCWLKQDVPAAKPDPCCVSGVK